MNNSSESNSQPLYKQDRFIRMRELPEDVGLAKSTIYKKISEGTFPRPIKLGIRASGWRESDIKAWKQDPSSYTIKGA